MPMADMPSSCADVRIRGQSGDCPTEPAHGWHAKIRRSRSCEALRRQLVSVRRRCHLERVHDAAQHCVVVHTGGQLDEPLRAVLSMEGIEAGRAPLHAGFRLALRITLAHFSVSSAISLLNSAGASFMGAPPKSANRACILGSARPVLISRPILSTASAGVPLGPPMPYHALVS